MPKASRAAGGGAHTPMIIQRARARPSRRDGGAGAVRRPGVRRSDLPMRVGSAAVDLLAAIADERRRIADLVDSLTPAQLAVPSLCGDWTVQEVAGHLAVPVVTPSPAVLPVLVRSGFRLHRANARLAAAIARRPAGELAAALRENAEHPFKPPVVGWPGQLTDLQVHGQDMRRPLGLPHGLRLDRMRESLTFLTGGRAPRFTPRRPPARPRVEGTHPHSAARDRPGPGRPAPGPPVGPTRRP